MSNIFLNLTRSGLEENKILAYQSKVNDIHDRLGNPDDNWRPYLGWTNSPSIWIEQTSKINDLASKIRGQSKALFVIGIGGSYLGARAVIESLRPYFSNKFAEANGELEVYFAGQNLSTDYLHELLKIAHETDFSLIVISKSGATLEPALAFRLFREVMEEKYGESARERIYVITDENSGVLKEIADREGFEKLPVPSDTGGRFSVLTPVGLLPIAAAGINIYHLLEGARDMANELLSSADLNSNIAYRYAVARNILYHGGKKIEILVGYEPKLHFFGEWWKQLFGESEGKNGTGLFPASLSFTTDLHSLGQYIQEGPRIMFETVINAENSQHNIEFSSRRYDDKLQYIEGKSLNHINQQAMEGTITAHSGGDVPNIVFTVQSLLDYNIGQLLYMFEKSCAMSASLLGVNPFDQPGVEHYKRQMFSLLGKPE